MTISSPLSQRAFRARQRYRTSLGAAYYGESEELLTAVEDGSTGRVGIVRK